MLGNIYSTDPFPRPRPRPVDPFLMPRPRGCIEPPRFPFHKIH